MKNPKLRFRQEDGGAFSDWICEKLEDLTSEVASGRSVKQCVGKYPLYGATGIIGRADTFDCDGEGILVARVGSVGTVNFCVGRFAVSDNAILVRTKQNLSTYFLFCQLKRVDWKSLASGTSQPVVAAKKLKNCAVAIGCEREQAKITQFFSALDEKIALAERKLTALQNLKSGLMQKIFSREIRFGQDEDSKYPAWKERNFGDIITLISGQDFPLDKYNDFGKGIPYLTGASCISCGQSIESRWTEYPRCLVQSGDVLIVCKGNGVGKVAVVAQEKAHIARQFMAVRAKQDLVDQQFCFYLIQSMVGKIIKNATGMIVGLSRKDITDNTVYLPEKEEQKKISLLFVNIDKKLNIARKILMQLRLLKQAFMQQMFI